MPKFSEYTDLPIDEYEKGVIVAPRANWTVSATVTQWQACVDGEDTEWDAGQCWECPNIDPKWDGAGKYVWSTTYLKKNPPGPGNPLTAPATPECWTPKEAWFNEGHVP